MGKLTPRHGIREEYERLVYSYGLVVETWTFYYSDGTNETVTKRTFGVL